MTAAGNEIDSPVVDSLSGGQKELKHIKSSFALSVFWGVLCFFFMLDESFCFSRRDLSADLSSKIISNPPWLHMSSFRSFMLAFMKLCVEKKKGWEDVFCCSFCVLFRDIWTFAAFLMATFQPQLEYQPSPLGRTRLQTANCVSGCARRHWNTKRRQSRLSASEQSCPSRSGRRDEKHLHPLLQELSG